jgi:hypothetical protein
MRVIKTMVGGALFAVVGVAGLLGLLWLDHARETALHTPTTHHTHRHAIVETPAVLAPLSSIHLHCGPKTPEA